SNCRWRCDLRLRQRKTGSVWWTRAFSDDADGAGILAQAPTGVDRASIHPFEQAVPHGILDECQHKQDGLALFIPCISTPTRTEIRPTPLVRKFHHSCSSG